MTDKHPECYIGGSLGYFINHTDDRFMVEGLMVPEFIAKIVFDPKKINEDEDLWHCIYDKTLLDAYWDCPLSQFKIKTMLRIDDSEPWDIWLDEEGK